MKGELSVQYAYLYNSLNLKYAHKGTYINLLHTVCSCVFVTPPNQGREKQTLDFNRLTSSTLALFQRELAAKSLSKLNNSITAMQNTHNSLLKPGHFRGEKFIDFKLLPLGPSPLISGKTKKGEEGHTMTVAQLDAGVQMLACTLMLIAHHIKDFILQCGSC